MLLSFGLGFLGALSFAPLYVWPFLMLSFAGLFRLMIDQSLLRALKLFFSWCFGFFLLSFHWVSFSLSVDWTQFWFLLPLAALGIPLIVSAVHVGILGMLLSVCQVFYFKGASVFYAFLVSWGVAEYARETFLHFPWNFCVHVWGGFPSLMQSVSLWGAGTLSLLTLGLFISPHYSALTRNASVRFKGFLPLSVFSLLFVGLWIMGKMRLQQITATHHSAYVRLVQPNLPALLKRNFQQEKRNWKTLVRLSRENNNSITHIIWPESALSYVRSAFSSEQLKALLAPNKILMTGLVHRDLDNLYNSLMSVDAKGRFILLYHKQHLTPFGEYVPGRHFLSRFIPPTSLRALTMGFQDFTPGRGVKRVVQVKGLPPFMPLICFDTSFQDATLFKGDHRPLWLLEITNNVWFGNSWALPQHLDHGRFRAIEAGVPLVRCTNTGISALISPYGTLVHTLPRCSSGFLDIRLPKALPMPLYQTVRNTFFWALLSLMLSLLLYHRFQGFFKAVINQQRSRLKKASMSRKQLKKKRKTRL